MNGRPLERRQLTIMFTDLVDSTGLADSMDPEDFRALIEAHRTIAVAPILRYGGVVARYLGDGMLVLFGYPEAHEDDPDRAVRAGLEVASATEAMNARWVGEGKGRIAVRIGVHTGIVIIGDVLKADVQEIMAVFGNAPSIAARLQALAKPNSVVLSGATKMLLPPSILCETRGNTTLKGMKRPVEIFAAVEVREGAVDRRVAGAVLPFVNRETELATIRRCWAAARRGEGRCLMIEGDPGIGKSRLIRAVEERIVTQPSRWLITRTSPYAANTDFFAFSELFRQLLPIGKRTDASQENDFDRLRAVLHGQGFTDPDMTIGLANLLGIDLPEDALGSPVQPERARKLTLSAIVDWLQHAAGNQALVLVIEDLHWADASSLEAIERLKVDLAHHAILLILTARVAAGPSPAATGKAPTSKRGSSVQGPSKATRSLQSDRTGPADPVSIGLDRLQPTHAEDLLGHVLRGIDLPKPAVATLLKRANGVPLYLEELPKPVLEAGGRADGAPIELPATLRDSLMAQLDSMGDAKSVAQTAAVLGHSFERSLLEHVWEGEERRLQTGLAALADAALLRRDGDVKTQTYGFRHALLAEIAYDSLLRDDRDRIHRKTANILAKHFRPLSETRPELLARHYEASGNHEEAFECWLKAGKAAAARSANLEAIEQLRHAEASLEKSNHLDPQEIDQRHLALQMARAPIQVALLGWSAPEVEETYRKAWNLSQSSETKIDDRFAALGGLYNVYLLRGDLSKARAANDQRLSIARCQDNERALPIWHGGAGYCDFLTGRFTDAEIQMDKNLALYAPNLHTRHMRTYGTHPSVIANSAKAWSQWFLGKFTKSKHSSKAAVQAAQDASHPFSVCYALCFASSIAQCRADAAAALDHAEQALALAAEYSFPYWIGWAGVVRGWAVARMGDPARGITILDDGMKNYEATGAAQMRGYMLCLAADVSRLAERFDEAAAAADQAIGDMERTGITFYQAEAYRLLGELQLSLSEGSSRPLRTSIRAMHLARQQRSLPLELRAVQSMLMMTDRDGLRSAIENRKDRLSEKLAAYSNES